MRFLFLFLSVFALTLSACAGGAASRSDAQLPPDGDRMVIQWEWDLGGEAENYVERSGPQLQILADGRVFIHDPIKYKTRGEEDAEHIALIETRIDVSEVEELLAFIAQDTFYATDSLEVFDAHDEFRRIADAGTTTVAIQSRERSHHVWIYALDQVSEETPIEDPRVKHMVVVTKKLNALRDRLIEENPS